VGEFLDYLRKNNLIRKRSDLAYLNGTERRYAKCRYFAMIEVAKTHYFDWIEPSEADELCINCTWHQEVTPDGGFKLQFDCTNPFLKDKTVIYDQGRMFNQLTNPTGR